MKNRRTVWVVSAVVLFTLLLGFQAIGKLTATRYGKLDTMIAIISKGERLINPISFNGKQISEIRFSLDNNTRMWKSKPLPIFNVKNMSVAGILNNVPVRIYTPGQGSNFPMIVFSHGGAWVGGKLDDYDNFCRKLSIYTNAVVVSVGYRLAPENPFPAGLDDIYNVILWVHKNAAILNGDPNRLCVAGDSAGGNLTAAVTLMLRDKSGPQPMAQVLICPSTDIYVLNTKSWSYFGADYTPTKENINKCISLYAPTVEERKNPYASPLLASNLKGLPDTLTITAEFDPLRDEGEAYGNKLKSAGINSIVSRYKGVTHDFILMESVTKKSDMALKEICQYMQVKFKK